MRDANAIKKLSLVDIGDVELACHKKTVPHNPHNLFPSVFLFGLERISMGQKNRPWEVEGRPLHHLQFHSPIHHLPPLGHQWGQHLCRWQQHPHHHRFPHPLPLFLHHLALHLQQGNLRRVPDWKVIVGLCGYGYNQKKGEKSTQV